MHETIHAEPTRLPSKPVGDGGAATWRHTRYGTVIGNDESAINGTYTWKGVPFARPPVGELRWKAPVDPRPWPVALATQEFASAAVQSGRLYGPGSNNRFDASIAETLDKTVGSEDCLYLNIWQPAQAAAPLPVIVFVHGGSNITGYTADPVYDGATLARTAGAVVVTVNYRLGIFGFLDIPALKTGADAQDDSGNFALLDLVKALEFVRDNIANFGGDPDRVTVTGQSAGAVNVCALLTSPLVVAASPPLLHGAIALSGGLSLASDLPPGRLSALHPVAAHRAQGAALLLHSLVAAGTAADVASAQAFVATQSDAQVAAWLRSLSADALLGTVRTSLAPLGLAGSGPIPEGVVVPVEPTATIRAGNYRRVPVLTGITRDEGKLFPGFLALSPALGGTSGRRLKDAEAFHIQFGYDPEAAPATRVDEWIPAQYLPASTPVTGFDARTEQLNQLFFAASRDSLMAAFASQQSELWHYRFDWDEEPAPFDVIYGAAHGFDVPFAFGNFGPSVFSNVVNTRANAPGRLALSDAMMKSIGAFAASGDPNHAALGQPWRPWPQALVLDATPDAAAISSIAQDAAVSSSDRSTGDRT